MASDSSSTPKWVLVWVSHTPCDQGHTSIVTWMFVMSSVRALEPLIQKKGRLLHDTQHGRLTGGNRLLPLPPGLASVLCHSDSLLLGVTPGGRFFHCLASALLSRVPQGRYDVFYILSSEKVVHSPHFCSEGVSPVCSTGIEDVRQRSPCLLYGPPYPRSKTFQS